MTLKFAEEKENNEDRELNIIWVSRVRNILDE